LSPREVGAAPGNGSKRTGDQHTESKRAERHVRGKQRTLLDLVNERLRRGR
jgi:hypothetical protein